MQSNLKLLVQHNDKDVLHMFDLGKACGTPSDAPIQAFDIVQDDLLNLYLCFAYQPRNLNCSQLAVMMPFMPSTLMSCLSEGTELRQMHGVKLEFDSPKQIIMVFAYLRLIPYYSLMVYFDVSRGGPCRKF